MAIKSLVKWRKYDSTGKLVREVAKRPLVTLNDLQKFVASSGCVVHVTTISSILHISGLWGRVARRKPFVIN